MAEAVREETFLSPRIAKRMARQKEKELKKQGKQVVLKKQPGGSGLVRLSEEKIPKGKRSKKPPRLRELMKEQ